MVLNLKSKIWLTVAAVVLMFSFFTLYYFPDQQAKLLYDNYNTEIQNLANTVSLGVKIGMTEQNFEGVQMAMEFVKNDPRLEFVYLLQVDTVWNEAHTSFVLEDKLFKAFPANKEINLGAVSNDSSIVKRSSFETPVISGAVLIGFSTEAINIGKQRIRVVSLLVSGLVLGIGIVLGFVLARNISGPVMDLRSAAIRVSQGDFTPRVDCKSNDEIGDLGKSFNIMVDYLSRTTQKLKEANQSLATTNDALHNTVLELNATQNQLIQKEKMASLGELTAGIAHEIQNPLNFVNNFSSVNQNLIDEMLEELEKGDVEEATAIANDIKVMAEKIGSHGKRADAIVKGMLQHSRSSTGEKKPIDLNALAEEYLRLSYHGLRAKDTSFVADYKTDLDEAIGQVEAAPEDLSRVLLNLCNNAFYSVTEKKKQADKTYKPSVVVSTRRMDGKVEISVKDNGTGIPEKVLSKIFNPFFTTKPAGQGTGLGLSLSYDIVVKGHGGELSVKTHEGQGTEFIIQLPYHQAAVLST
ncbi:HAMP domain-containing sensor histidine kinase [Persicitalea jodogahamensis]|nr:HAMP domain-containing sensor histidine kinase [Persicitalea jodogahamensis]